ncbi:putative retrotransposon ty1-copia subclass protein [Tanacetum coccineum]
MYLYRIPKGNNGLLLLLPTREQDENTHPSENTSLHLNEDDQEINEPQSDIILVRMSMRTQNAPDRMCLYVDADEHELGDLNEPADYKTTLLDPEYYKWLTAMNVEMQSIKDNQVWDLVDLPPNDKIVASKWLFKKKTNMDGKVHTYKARLVVKASFKHKGLIMKKHSLLLQTLELVGFLLP